MIIINTRASFSTQRRALGYSLIEVMIALTVGLFLLAGVVTIFGTTRQTSASQTGLAQLQDNERIAMLMLTNTIESAGYYTNAQTVALTTALPVSAAFAQAGQSVVGGTDASGNGTVTVRYQGDASGNVLNCLGSPIAAGVLQEMQFSIQAVPAVANKYQLVCSVNNAQAVPLVRDVQSLTILYGVASAATTANAYAPVDAYLPAGQMTPINWTNVSSVKITVTFANPLAGDNTIITFTRVIGLMSHTGVNVVNYT